MAKEEQEPKLVRPRDLSIYPEKSEENKMSVYNLIFFMYIFELHYVLDYVNIFKFIFYKIFQFQ